MRLELVPCVPAVRRECARNVSPENIPEPNACPECGPQVCAQGPSNVVSQTKVRGSSSMLLLRFAGAASDVFASGALRGSKCGSFLDMTRESQTRIANEFLDMTRHLRTRTKIGHVGKLGTDGHTLLWQLQATSAPKSVQNRRITRAAKFLEKSSEQCTHTHTHIHSSLRHREGAKRTGCILRRTAKHGPPLVREREIRMHR